MNPLNCCVAKSAIQISNQLSDSRVSGDLSSVLAIHLSKCTTCCWSGDTVGTVRLQEKAGTTEEELGRCHQTGPPTDGPDLGRSRGAGE